MGFREKQHQQKTTQTSYTGTYIMNVYVYTVYMEGGDGKSSYGNPQVRAIGACRVTRTRRVSIMAPGNCRAQTGLLLSNHCCLCSLSNLYLIPRQEAREEIVVRESIPACDLC